MSIRDKGSEKLHVGDGENKKLEKSEKDGNKIRKKEAKTSQNKQLVQQKFLF